MNEETLQEGEYAAPTPPPLESNFDPIEFFAPPPARGHWVNLGAGMLLGAAGLTMVALTGGWISAPSAVTWALAQATQLGVTPALTLFAGVLLFGVGVSQRQSVHATQRLHDELARQPSTIPFLEEVDFQQQNLHVNLVHVENRVRETLTEVLVPIHQDLAQLLSAHGGGGVSVGGENQEALWRLAASLDQVGARLEQFVGQRMSELGEEISSELADSTSSLAETLKQPLEELRATNSNAQNIQRQPEMPAVEPAAALPSDAQAPQEVQHAVGAKPIEQKHMDGSVDHLGLLDEIDAPTSHSGEERSYNPYEDAPSNSWENKGGSIFDDQSLDDGGPLNMRPKDM